LLITRNPLSLFVTVMFCVLDASTGQMRFCSAGQGMPLIRRANGEAERVIGRPSPMLGLIETANYANHTICLAAGEAVVLNTDGFEEAQGEAGEWFGTERLMNAVAGADHNASAAEILSASMRAVERFCGQAPLADDLTCVVARWTPDA
jgi:sigma-B regulation protein RsbU (phosphoserine phosphatase)